MKKAAFRDRRLSDVTAEIFRREGDNISDQDRRFITMMVQGTVRLTGRLDWELRQVFVGDYKDLKEGLRILLRLGVFQLFYMDSVPDYAAVTTTVQLAKNIHPNLGGLTNAILRTLAKLEDRDVPDEHTPIANVADYLSHPEWLISKWIKDKSFAQAQALAEWNNEYPNFWFRVNRTFGRLCRIFWVYWWRRGWFSFIIRIYFSCKFIKCFRRGFGFIMPWI
jgi:transcription termination factor NusB